MTQQPIQYMPIDQLIDRFNEPCDQPTCRFTSHRVNDEWCPQHGPFFWELERRREAMMGVVAGEGLEPSTSGV